jgi:hypothetical protein
MADKSPIIMTAQQFDDVLKRIDEKFNAAVAEAQKDISPMLAAGVMYKIGEFSVMLAEDTNQLKVTTLHPSKHLEIRPKTDNSVEIKSCRQTTDIK